MMLCSDVCEVLAWGSAQIHCQCSVNESRVRLAAASPKQAEERAVTNAGNSWRTVLLLSHDFFSSLIM